MNIAFRAASSTVEQLTLNQEVRGSRPWRPIRKIKGIRFMPSAFFLFPQTSSNELFCTQNAYSSGPVRYLIFALACIAVTLLLFGLAGCMTIGSQLNDPAFQTQNQPVRTLRVLVAADPSYDQQDIDTLMRQVSDSPNLR